MFAVNSFKRFAALGLVLVGTGAVANDFQQSIEQEMNFATNEVNQIIQQNALHEARQNAWEALISYEAPTGLLTFEQELDKQTEAIAEAAKLEAQKLAASYWRTIAPSFMVAVVKGE